MESTYALGDIMTAEQAIKKVNELDPSNANINNEIKRLEILKRCENEAIKAYDKKDYRKVVCCMDRCLYQASTCARYKINKAECLAFLGICQKAQEIANDILHIDRSNADAMYVQGICLFYEDNIESAMSHFQQVLRLASDHKKAMDAYKRAKALKKKKEEGNDAYNSCKFQEAVNLYTEVLDIDPLNKKTNAKLHFNRATVLARLTKLKEAVADCTAALNLDYTYLKALLRRAKCYMDLTEYEDAILDYEKACKMDNSRGNKKLLQAAKLALKKSKDYYKIMAVDRTATDDEIKKAYRKRALVHHPDRHANASEAEKKVQEKKFKEVGEAYDVLSNPAKKARYDCGQDMDDFKGGIHGDTSTTQVFRYGTNTIIVGSPESSFTFGSGSPSGSTPFTFTSGSGGFRGTTESSFTFGSGSPSGSTPLRSTPFTFTSGSAGFPGATESSFIFGSGLPSGSTPLRSTPFTFTSGSAGFPGATESSFIFGSGSPSGSTPLRSTPFTFTSGSGGFPRATESCFTFGSGSPSGSTPLRSTPFTL